MLARRAMTTTTTPLPWGESRWRGRGREGGVAWAVRKLSALYAKVSYTAQQKRVDLINMHEHCVHKRMQGPPCASAPLWGRRLRLHPFDIACRQAIFPPHWPILKAPAAAVAGVVAGPCYR